MDEKHPRLVAIREQDQQTILILDKNGRIGLLLAEKMQEHFKVIMVSGKDLLIQKNILSVPYNRRIPLIPDNPYKAMILFYSGDDTLFELIPKILEKAKTLHAKVLLVTSVRFASEKVMRKLAKQQFLEMQLVIYGDLFYPEDIVDNPVNYFLHQATAHGKITLVDDGIGGVYPIALADVLSGIVSITFSHNKQRVIYLFAKTPVSDLSIARILKKHNPLLKVDFKKRKKKEAPYYFVEDKEYFYTEYPLENRLDAIIDAYQPREEAVRLDARTFSSRRQFLTLSSVGALLFALLLPIMLFVLTGLFGFGTLVISERELEQGKFSNAKTTAIISHEAFSLAELLGKGIFYVDPFAKEPKTYLLQQVSLGKTLSKTELDGVTGIMLMQKVLAGESNEGKKDFLHSLALIKNAVATLTRLQAEDRLPSSLAQRLRENNSITTKFFNINGALPSVLGFDEERKYLLLFQNNMELRPGGGFIGSYGIVSLKDGSIKSFKMYDVYDADGQLRTHIEPPFALRRYLGASHLFLRDSNYSLDFPTNAQRAVALLRLETGDRVDGVVAFDTNILNGLLSVTGPVKLAGYQEKATAENVYLLTQKYVEKDFFPGSTQKKDFLRALMNACFAQITEMDVSKKLALAQELGELTEKKHILFSFVEPSEQHVFTANNLSSSLWDSRQQESGQILDTLGVIDMNVGMNKVNYYVTRTLEQHVSFTSKGNVDTTMLLTYTNASTQKSPFGGDYKNYLRIMLPKGAILQEVSINGQKMKTREAITKPSIFTAKKFVAPKELEIETTEEQGRMLVGFLLVVPKSETRKLVVTYTYPHAFSSKDASLTYDLSVFKQPGTQDDPYSLFITQPKGYKFISASPGVSNVGGKLAYSTYLTEDKSVTAVFSKQ